MGNKIRLKIDSRFKQAHKRFGQQTPVDFPPEVNYDDPNIPEKVQPVGDVMCTIYTTAYIAQNKTKKEYDMDEFWANIDHNMFGADPFQVLGRVVKVGFKIKGTDIYDKPFSSYWDATTGYFDKFDNTRSAQLVVKSPLAIWTSWYDNWLGLGQNAIMPIGRNPISGHMYATKGWGTITGTANVNGVPMYIIEWWGGYTMYMPRETFNKALSETGAGCAVLSDQQVDEIHKRNVLEYLKDQIINLYLALISILQKKIKDQTPMSTQPTPSPTVPVVESKPHKLYDLSYSLIGKHLTMDNSVPALYGCAQALSYVLKEFGLPIPDKGISSTNEMDKWLQKNCTQIDKPDVGDIIISISYTGIAGARGHCGIVGKKAIMSNDSETGLWQPYWSLAGWLGHYKDDLKLVTKYYRV